MKQFIGLIVLTALSVVGIVSCGGGGGDGVTRMQMGGSIQGIPLSLKGVVTTLSGTAGSSGSTDGTGTAARFLLPYGITTDGTNLYVADSFNHTIRAID